MVKELYINEKLFVSLNKNKIKPILIGEQYKTVGPKELKSESYSFIKRYPHIMEYLRNGNVIKSIREKDIIKSSIGKVENKNESEDSLKIISEVQGYSYEESIENLEFSLLKPQKKKGRK